MRKNKNRKIISIIAMALALIMVIGILASLIYYAAGTANAATVSELESQKVETERQLEDLKNKQSSIKAEADKLQDEISELKSQSATFAEQKKALDEKVELKLEEIANIESQLDTYNKLIEEKELELEDAEAEQAYQLEVYKKRLRAMEEDSNLSYFSILFSANNFSDLLNKIYDVQEVMEYYKLVAEQLEEATWAVENAKARLEETKAELEEKRIELEETKIQLEEDIIEAQEAIDNLQIDIDKSEEDYKALEEDRERVDNEIASKTQNVNDLDSSIKAAIAQAKADEAARAAASAPSGGSTSGGSPYTPASGSRTGTGDFIWPTSSTNVTSGYGYRTHPITGAYKLHAGIDISASTGTAIYAAADGQVVTSTYSSSYGYYILINHGNGKYTLYAHCSALYVSAGEGVYQGQTIAAVGSTGNSTGPHLHFEVRINGSTVNPLNYYS